MYLDKVLLKDFGQFHNKELEPGPGINVISGDEDGLLADFTEAMLYGIKPSFFAGDRVDPLEKRRPSAQNALDTGSFSGKLYMVKDGDRVLVEREFLKRNPTLSVLDLSTGREMIPRKRDTLYGTLTDVPQGDFNGGLVMDCERLNGEDAPDKIRNLVCDLAETGTTRFHLDNALAELMRRRATKDSGEVDAQIEDIDASLLDYDGVEEELEAVRDQIREVEDEFAIETARRKREARKLIDTRTGEAKYVENKDVNEDLDALAENRIFLDAELMKELEPEKKLTDRWYIILLTMLFVTGVIAALVYILPFDEPVRYIFIGCTVFFEIVTVVSGLFEKGVFDGEVAPPTEEEFKRIIYDLERKNEAYEDVEIDMSFAKEFLDKKDKLRETEKDLSERLETKNGLKEQRKELVTVKRRLSEDRTSVTLAVNTLNELVKKKTAKNRYYINGCVGKYIGAFTGGVYTDARITSDRRLVVKDTLGRALDIMHAESACVSGIGLAVYAALIEKLNKDRLPVIIKGAAALGTEDKTRLLAACGNGEIAADQFIFADASSGELDAFIASSGIEYRSLNLV